MTWWLNTSYFIRTITTVTKSITMEFLADAQIVGTPELINRAVARLLTDYRIFIRPISTVVYTITNVHRRDADMILAPETDSQLLL